MSEQDKEKPESALPSTQIFTIHCRTGCTCCSGDNHWRGPYRTDGDATRRIAHFRNPENKFCPVASQYSRRGNYSIHEDKMETLPDGRAIIRSEVLEETPEFIEVADDGSVADNMAERLDLGCF